MFPGHVLQPEPALKQKNAAIEIEGLGLGLGFRNLLPCFGPIRENGGRKEPRGKLPLLSRRPLAGRREADQPLDETEQKRKIKIETLRFARAREPVDETVKVRSLDLRQSAE